MERLQRVLAKAGLASRRGAEKLIREGRVTVNGQKIVVPETMIDPARDEVKVDGKTLLLPAAPSVTYLLLNKPRGVLTSRTDPHHSETVYDLLPEGLQHLHYVGRLDKESEGLLLFTDDGDLTYLLTHPSHGILKTYQVEVSGSLTAEKALQLKQGVRLEEGTTAPAEVRILDRAPGRSRVEIQIHEGRKRQVRRMFEAVGCRVDRLVRTTFGPLTLGYLKPGQHRKLTPSEIQSLRQAPRARDRHQ
ncbi:MAG: rRNA pseudouridine synthase [Armatimonadetes bacterium]|nr:rRNA pseudouridine synthase [Armatimonadota bacterium]